MLLRSQIQCLLLDRARHLRGWPYSARTGQLAVEPTALAVLATNSYAAALTSTQRKDGSWAAICPASSEFGGNCAATALATIALLQKEPSRWDAEGALKWLCSTTGIESHWFWRWRFKTTDTQVSFDPDKFGWGWVPGTASWVIPTSFAVIALRVARKIGLRAPGTKDRIRLGADMLLDRSCPRGGWNAGNSRIFGVPLSPHADATAIALLALRGIAHQNEQIDRALDRLLDRSPAGAGPLSLAWTIIALHAYRDHRAVTAEIESRSQVLEKILQNPSRISDNTTLAVSALAFDAVYTKNVFEVGQ